MATGSIGGFGTTYVDGLVVSGTLAYRSFTTYLLPGETFHNANLDAKLGMGGGIPTQVTPTVYIYRGTLDSTPTYVFPPFNGAILTAAFPP